MEELNNVTLETLFNSIQHLTQKCGILEKEIDRLNSLVSKPIRPRMKTPRIKTIPEMIHSYYPTVLWKNYTTPVTSSQMKYIFQGDMVYTIENIINQEMVNLPLAAYKEKSNTIYVYGAEIDAWTIFTEKQFNEWMETIKHQILKQFLKWKAEEEKKMNDEENPEAFIDKSMRYLQRIIGGNTSKENEALFKWLVKILKQR